MKKLLLALCLMIATAAQASVPQQPIVCPQSEHAIRTYHSVVICQRVAGNFCKSAYNNNQAVTIEAFLKESGYTIVHTRIDVASPEDGIIFMCLEVSK